MKTKQLHKSVLAPKKKMGRPKLPPGASRAMAGFIGIDFSDEQTAALSEFCTRHDASLTAVVREFVLQRLLPEQSGGAEAFRGTGKGRIAGTGRLILPLRMTAAQAEFVKDYCKKLKVPAAAFIRELVLTRIGAQHLSAVRRVLDGQE